MSGLTPQLQAVARDVLARASLVLAFNPIAMLPANLREENAAKVVSFVADHATEFFWEGQTYWRLDPEARRQELARLVTDGKLSDTISLVEEHAKDKFGYHLRRALKGEAVGAKDVPADDLDSAYAAAAFAAEALRSDLSRAAVAELRARLAATTEIERSEAILKGPLYGRKHEKAALDRYIATGLPPEGDRLKRPAEPALGVRPYLIAGAAGSGKSALIADLVRRRRGQMMQGPPVAVLDFGQSALAIGGPLEWTAEVTRHIALGYPDLDDRLSRTRAEVLESAGQASSTAWATLDALHALNGHMAKACSESNLAGSQVLLVLETFDEVFARSRGTARLEDALFGRILAWASSLADLRYSGRPVFPDLRIIVSINEPPNLPTSELGRWFSGMREIKELDASAAVEFLMAHDTTQQFTKARAKRAVANLDRNPLAILLLEYFARRLPPVEFDRVLASASNRQGLSSSRGNSAANVEDAVRALYTLFLRRPHDAAKSGMSDSGMVGKLAHSSLMLREMDTELLQKVVAPACGVERLETEAAGKLFSYLANEVWIVESASEAGPRSVHRTDVRRVMLRPSHAGSSASVDLNEVLRRAIDWYASRPDAYVLANYYRALAGITQSLLDNATLCQEVAQLAGDDVLIMPGASRALLRLQQVGSLRLSIDELHELPNEHQTHALEQFASEDRRLALTKSYEIPTMLNEPLGRTYSNYPQLRTFATRMGLDTRTQILQQTATKVAAEPSPFSLRVDGQTELVIPQIANVRGVKGDLTQPQLSSGALREQLSGSGLNYSPSPYDLVRDRGLSGGIANAFVARDFQRVVSDGDCAITELVHSLPDLSAPLPTPADPLAHWIWQVALGQLARGDAKAQERWRRMIQSLAERPEVDRCDERSGLLYLATALSIGVGGRLDVSEATERLAQAVDRGLWTVRSTLDFRMLGMTRVWRRKSAQRALKIRLPCLQVFAPRVREILNGPGADFTHDGSEDAIAYVRLIKSSSVSPSQIEIPAATFDTLVTSGRRVMLTLSMPAIGDAQGPLATIVPGVVPELYDLLADTFVDLLRRPVDDRVLVATVRRLASEAPVWPAEEVEWARLRNVEQRAAKLVRLAIHADRCGLLPKFVAHFADEARDSNMALVSALLLKYQHAVAGVAGK